VGAALTCWPSTMIPHQVVWLSSAATLKLALRCRPHDKFMLVTDAMPTVGSESKAFILQGKRIVAHDGACVDESGTLAGSDLDMAWAVRNAVRMLELPLETAFAMASAVPAAFLRLDGEYGAIAPGYRADLALLDEQLIVRETWIGGEAAGQA
jgi:N-acetylglucosamine-6-phosphate deacetylase